MIKCSLCNNKFKTHQGLVNHILHSHKYISTKEYYDKFLKKKNEGFCKVCNKRTTFYTMVRGYATFCSGACANKDPSVRKKIESTCIKKTGYKCNFSNPTTRKKIKKTWIRKHGVDNPLKNRKIRKQASITYFNKTGYSNPSQNPEVKYKKEKTSLKNNGTKSPLQNKKIRKKASNTYFKRTGYYNPSQNPEVHAKVFSKKKKPKSEIYFKKLLKKNGLKFKNEYHIRKENIWQHNFDFAIFKKDKLKCLIEIDGEFFHGLCCDCDGYHSLGNNDYLRWKIIPKMLSS